ncbi:MAG TPA: phage tail sheath C-terminal domain-containing protein [Burkholderiales bacterium]|nr:phage tail sheath C-terminal domain-containing protein [Burkholderiales bacterium]
MTTVSYPGVYVEEIPGGARPIEAAGTSTAAFVGVAEKGPDDDALRVTSWEEFQKSYGSFVPASYLAEAVFSFFNNGGRQCYIVRVAPSDALAASVALQNRAAVNDAVRFSARSKGAWGNSLVLTLEDASADTSGFKLTVRRQAKSDDPVTNPGDLPELESHDNLSMDPDSPGYAVKVLARDSATIEMESLAANTSLQRGFHRSDDLSGVTLAPMDSTTKLLVNVDDDGYQEVTLETTSTTLAQVATDIETKLKALTRKKTSTAAAAFTGFNCTLESNRLVLRSGTTTNPKSSVRVQNASSSNAAVKLKLGEGNGGVSEDGLAVRRPANSPAVQVGDNAVGGVVTAATLGIDGTAALNELSYANQFTLLDDKSDFSLLAVPGIGTQQMMDLGVAYCQNRALQDVFYVGETGKFDDTVSEAESFRKSLTKANSYGGLYFPWVRALDPSGRTPGAVLLPPSGYVAGLYARIDGARGVWKAPAGTEASLNGVVGLATELTDVQQGNLNPISVNVLRRFDLSGVIVWGARTVSSDPEYKYVPVRRTAIMLRKSIYDGIQWAVFEPNDQRLWSALRTNIGAFMNSLFRAGAFQGEKANDAYFVRCGLGDTMVQDDIDRGQVIVLVGFAPLKPAEFVIVRIQQKAGQQ